MSAIGIVIVTFNSGAEIGACLDAALASGAEVVVVDNGSHDATIAEVARRGGRLVANSTNRGFAGAVNQGFSALNCPYILLLNPDAILLTSIQPLREACDLPRSAGAGGRLVDLNGNPQTGFMFRRLPTPTALILEVLLLNRVWPNNPVNRRYRALDLSCESHAAMAQRVEQPAGAFLMIRRAVWEKLGGFDEGFYPLWFEDVDFCRRALDQAYVLYYTPAAVARHAGAHSIPQLTPEMRYFYWYRSLLRYTAKHCSPFAFRVMCLAVVTGSFARGLIEVLGRWNPQPMTACRKVVRLASRSFFFGWRDQQVPSDPTS
jgi:N-acetylglucosaminyl-diphospho-decaprenol L-rhamnosyltransferase